MAKPEVSAGLMTLALVVVILAGIAVVGYIGLGLGNKSGSTAGNTVYTKASYDYTGNVVPYDMKFYNKYTGVNVSPTCYVYNAQPANWNNARVTADSGYVQTGATSDGTKFEIAQLPGTYYVRCDLTSYFTAFETVVVPASGDAPLSQANPKVALVYMLPADTAGTSAVDMGVSGSVNATSLLLVKSEPITITAKTSYCLDSITVRATGTTDFAVPLTGAGTSSEGVKKLEFVISADTLSTPASWVPYDEGTGINDFGTAASGQAILKTFGSADKIILNENQGLTIVNKVTADTNTISATGDGKFSNGEQIATVYLYDCQGTPATYTITG